LLCLSFCLSLSFSSSFPFLYSSSLMYPPPPRSTLFPYTTLFRSQPLAIFEANYLGQIRTGAASGFATDLLARRDAPADRWRNRRSEEHTSELQSRVDIVCRLLLEKKKNITK